MCRARYSHQVARSSAVRPTPAASAQQKTPISLPATAASPALRPSRTVRCRNSAVDGPGSATTTRQASTNAGSTDRTCRMISLICRLHPSAAEAAKRFPSRLRDPTGRGADPVTPSPFVLCWPPWTCPMPRSRGSPWRARARLGGLEPGDGRAGSGPCAASLDHLAPAAPVTSASLPVRIQKAVASRRKAWRAGSMFQRTARDRLDVPPIRLFSGDKPSGRHGPDPGSSR
jgi:hypothetical protein